MEEYREITGLLNSSLPCSDKTIEFLNEHNCLFLLRRVSNLDQRTALRLTTNRKVVAFLCNQCKELFVAISELPYAYIKGASLSKRIYGKPFYRVSNDIDILISRQQYEQVAIALTSQGFSQGRIVDNEIIPPARRELLFYDFLTHQTIPFHKKTCNPAFPFVTVDINFTPIWGEAPIEIATDELLCHREKDSFCDLDYFRLCDEYEFVTMCLHHYKDMNSIYLLATRGYRFFEFLDIYFFLVNCKIDPNRVKCISDRLGVSNYIYCCIRYVDDLWHNTRIQQYLNIFKSRTGEELAHCYGLCDAERKEWKDSLLQRVFDPNFQHRFILQLNTSEFQKVLNNISYMRGTSPRHREFISP